MSPLGMRGKNRSSAGDGGDDGEKREIVGISKEHRNSASAAAMVALGLRRASSQRRRATFWIGCVKFFNIR